MVKFVALPTKDVRRLQDGGADAYGHPPERAMSDGGGNPCRHCLKDIPEGQAMLILAHRPFSGLHPYAETGPIFLCADPCAQGGGAKVPEVLTTSPDYLVKGYNDQDRIVYGTGQIVPAEGVADYADRVLQDAGVAYVHVRSARNNCYQLRIEA